MTVLAIDIGASSVKAALVTRGDVWVIAHRLEGIDIHTRTFAELNEAVQRTEEAYDTQVPLVGVTAETLRDRLVELVAAGPAEWRRIGELSRAYVERVHDVERIADALVELYEGLPR